ncbi:response regulator [Caballeronia novacaledonica]|uniref:response regulator n=1 Tax=Caballeronia novacaledonica TaxID=1544861 RepID=UPI001EE29552|nr:response regulator [Caballeronia novacaledonica]
MHIQQENWTHRQLDSLTRVLVVDDYRAAAIAVADYLSLSGFQTRVAGGCGDALEIIRNWVPDVVLLDLMMPQRDGFITARAIREYLPTSRTFICAYTGRDEVVITRCVEGRVFDGYFRKGASPPSLILYLNGLKRTDHVVSEEGIG